MPTAIRSPSPIASSASYAADSWPLPPSITIRSGTARRARARVDTDASPPRCIGREVVIEGGPGDAAARAAPLIRNFRKLAFFIRPSTPTTIDATVSRPWRVRDIEALDPPRHRRQREHRGSVSSASNGGGMAPAEARVVAPFPRCESPARPPAPVTALRHDHLHAPGVGLRQPRLHRVGVARSRPASGSPVARRASRRTAEARPGTTSASERRPGSVSQLHPLHHAPAAHREDVDHCAGRADLHTEDVAIGERRGLHLLRRSRRVCDGPHRVAELRGLLESLLSAAFAISSRRFSTNSSCAPSSRSPARPPTARRMLRSCRSPPRTARCSA